MSKHFINTIVFGTRQYGNKNVYNEKQFFQFWLIKIVWLNIKAQTPANQSYIANNEKSQYMYHKR